MPKHKTPDGIRSAVAAGAPLAISSSNRARSSWAWLWAVLAAAVSATVLYLGSRGPLDWARDGPLLYAVLGVTGVGTLYLVGRALIATTRVQTHIHYQMAKPFVVAPDAGTAGIPVRFDVPIGARATDEGLTKWVLTMTIAAPGIDADMAFEIPVQRA